jgi:hypothetical protein
MAGDLQDGWALERAPDRWKGEDTMQFEGMNYSAVLIAALAGFATGFVWYAIFGNIWMRALGKTKEQLKPRPQPFIVSIIALPVMAYVLAGLIGHMGELTLVRGMISAAFVWVGFVVTTTAVAYAFQGARWSLIAIDTGHWLLVLLVMGAIIGWMGV